MVGILPNEGLLYNPKNQKCINKKNSLLFAYIHIYIYRKNIYFYGKNHAVALFKK